jgi:tetratricopeptide (TPR) repeat protein
MACTRRRQYPAAIRSFDAALALDPESVEALTGRGNAFYALERYEDALGCYDRVIAAAPRAPGPHLARSNALSALGRRDEAAEAFSNAMALRRRPDRSN